MQWRVKYPFCDRRFWDQHGLILRISMPIDERRAGAKNDPARQAPSRRRHVAPRSPPAHSRHRTDPNILFGISTPFAHAAARSGPPAFVQDRQAAEAMNMKGPMAGEMKQERMK